MEIFICGAKAVSACLKLRAGALREIFVDEKSAENFEEIRAATRAENLPWTRIAAEELARLAETRAHGGIVARTERPEPGQVRPAMLDEWFAAGERPLFLENISDEETLAAIVRVAVLCGVTRVVADEKSTLPALARSRVWNASDGAPEFLKIYRTESMAGMLRAASARFFVVGFVREGGRKIDYAKPPVFPGKTVALFLSGDENGVPAGMISRCGYLFHVPEKADAPLRFSPADLCAHALPWICSAKSARQGTGFFARKKARGAS